MSSTFTCQNCGSSSYEQFSQTQVRCMQCKTITEFDTGYKVARQFEIEEDSTILDAPLKVELVSAPIYKRFLNNLIDMLFLLSAYSFIGNVEELLSVFLGKVQNTQALSIFMSMYVLYYFAFEFVFGKTIGKFITRTKVVSSDGSKASLLQCIGRSFSRFLPFENISFLIAGIFKQSDNNRSFGDTLLYVLTYSVFWHDSLPNTLVIQD